MSRFSDIHTKNIAKEITTAIYTFENAVEHTNQHGVVYKSWTNCQDMKHLTEYCYIVYSLHYEFMNITDVETKRGNRWAMDNAYNIWTNEGLLIVRFVKALGAVVNLLGTDIGSPMNNYMKTE